MSIKKSNKKSVFNKITTDILDTSSSLIEIITINDDKDLADILINNGYCFKIPKGYKEFNPLTLALESKNFKIAEFYIDNDLYINDDIDNYDNIPIVKTIEYGDLKWFKKLYNRIDINTNIHRNINILQYACAIKSLNIVNFLLNDGFDPSGTNTNTLMDLLLKNHISHLPESLILKYNEDEIKKSENLINSSIRKHKIKEVLNAK